MTYRLESLEQEAARKKVKIALALAASILLAVTPIFIRISENFLSPNATIFNRFWMVTIMVGLWNIILLNQGKNSLVKEFFDLQALLIPLVVLPISVVATQLLWAWSIAQTTVANSQVLHCLSPGFCTFAGWLIFQQKFSGKFLIGMVVAIGGTLAIGLSDMSHRISLEGDGLALLSAIFWAANIMSIEKLRSCLSPTLIVMLASGSCTLLSLPAMLIAGDQILPHSGRAWLIVICLAFNTLCSHSLVAYTLKWLSSALMTTIFLLSPVVSALVGFFLFSESLSLLNLLGFAVILVGLYLVISDEAESKISDT